MLLDDAFMILGYRVKKKTATAYAIYIFALT